MPGPPSFDSLPADQLRTVVDALPDGVAVHRDGVLVFVNPAGLRMLGYASARELVGQPVGMILHPDERPAVAERIRHLMATGEALPPREERLLRKDGEEVVARVRALPVLWQGAPAVMAYAQDVTEIRRFEERLTMADRLASVGTLAAGMAHDLNNPLAHLVLALDLAREAAGPEGVIPTVRADEIRRWIDGALDASERLRVIVDDLRVFARQPERSEQVLLLNAPIKAAVDLARNQLRHQCRIELDLDDAPQVRASEGRLVQVFLNLLMNALQAFPEDRPPEQNRITVRLFRSPTGDARVEVCDNGLGVPEEHAHRVFEPYFTTKPAGVGTGLGLWMVHGVVTRLGGQVRLVSEPDVGTVVQLDLPPAEGEAPSATPSGVGARGLRVLVVDDEPAIAELLADVLRVDHRVVVFTSGREALEAVRAADPPYDLIVCDLMMPDLGGSAIYDALVADGRGLERRVAFATGGAFTEDARAFLDRVDAKVLYKPFRLADVRSLVEHVRR